MKTFGAGLFRIVAMRGACAGAGGDLDSSPSELGSGLARFNGFCFGSCVLRWGFGCADGGSEEFWAGVVGDVFLCTGTCLITRGGILVVKGSGIFLVGNEVGKSLDVDAEGDNAGAGEDVEAVSGGFGVLVGFSEVKARNLASLSCKDGVITGLFGPKSFCGLGRPGTFNVGGVLFLVTRASGGCLCSSIRDRGAALTWVALLFSCLVGTARALFRFGAKMLFFFFESGMPERGICGRSKVQAGAPSGSEAKVAELGEAKTGVIPPTFRSYEA